MGKKNRKKQDDDDYFASLATSTVAPVEEEVDEEALERRLKAEEAARERAERDREREEAAALERAENAARAKAMMEKRARKKKGEEEEEEVVPEEVVVPLTSFERLLAALKQPREGLVGKLFWVLWIVLSALASSETLTRVDGPEENERRLRECLWADKWFEKGAVDPDVVRRVDEKVERKVKGKWVRVKDGEGWATQDQFYCLFENQLFECTEWAPLTIEDALKIGGDKACFFADRDGEGRIVATLYKRVAEELAAADNQAPPPKKEKLSRAEKKAKKQAYGR